MKRQLFETTIKNDPSFAIKKTKTEYHSNSQNDKSDNPIILPFPKPIPIPLMQEEFLFLTKSKEEKIKNHLTKDKIHKFLTSILHIELDNKILTDIVFKETHNELIVVGRAKLDGTSKQLNHIIPVKFIKNTIQYALQYSHSPENAMQLLFEKIKIFAKNQSGLALTEEQLKTKEYQEIFNKQHGLADRQIKINDQNVMLYSPSKTERIFSTPRKKAQAEKLYSLYNAKYVDKALKIFQEAINEYISDENFVTLICESLSRFIFIMCNKGKNISFAPEGNTLPYEIRLYGTEDSAQKNNDDYDVVKSREIKSMMEDGDLKDLDGMIRIVNCEGANIKKISKALKSLDDILGYYTLINTSDNTLISEYNENNLILKLSNTEIDITQYNLNLTLENCTINVYYHIAKQLYLAFDFKALEKDVFVPCSYPGQKSIKVYPRANSKKLAKYCIIEGSQYRELKMDGATQYPDESFFRNSDTDKDILPKKLAELFMIGTMIFKNLDKDVKINGIAILKHTLNLLVDLCSLDYELKENDQIKFRDEVFNYYNDWSSGLQLNNLDENIEISLAGENNGILEQFI